MTVIAGPWAAPTDGQLLAGRVHAARLEAATPALAGRHLDAVIVDELAGLTWQASPLDERWRAFGEAIAAAARTIGDTFTRLFADAGRAWADLVARWLPGLRRLPTARAERMRAAGRWHTDVEPRRWRDWQPSSERPIDRARRQRLARQLRRRCGGAA